MFILDEMMLEILCRLPVKSIFRFKSVCKQWYSLFNDPTFIDLHRKQALKRSNAIIMSSKMIKEHKYISFYSLDMMNVAAQNGDTTNLMLTRSVGREKYSMETPCNGLICFSGWRSHSIYVCNPRSQEFTKLPKASPNYPRRRKHWCKAVGFGFDNSINKYKVLRMFKEMDYDEEEESRLGCEVFTLGSADGKWKWVGYPSYPIRPHHNTASVNGAVHWMIEPSSDLGSSSAEPIILSFDFRDEKFRVVPLPKCSSWKCCEELNLKAEGGGVLQDGLELKVLGGYLCVVDKMDKLRLEIWMLKDYKNMVWVHEYSIDATQLPPYMKPYPHIFPEDVWDGKVLLSTGQRFCSYYAQSKTCKEFKCDVSGHYEPYVETLASFGGTYRSH